MAGRFVPLDAPLPLARRPMRVLTPVVEIATLAMFHPWQYLTLRRTVALQLVRNDHTWHIHQTLEQLTKELLRGLLIAPTLHKDIEHVIVLVHGSPQVGTFAMDREEDFIQMPLVARRRPSMPELIRVGLAELATLLPNRFIRHKNATSEAEVFHIAGAETKATIEPDGMADALRWKSVVFVGGG